MIDDIQIMRDILPTIASSSLDKYRRPISDAQKWFADKIAGGELMDRIMEMKDADPLPELFVRARLCVALRAYGEAIPQLDLVETPNGFAVVNDERLVPASRERVSALRGSIQNDFRAALDSFIEYMEDSDGFAAMWKRSPAYSIISDSYLPTLREFRRYGEFAGSYLDFIAARPVFRQIIVKYIEPVVSRELSEEIIAQLRDGTLSESNGRLLEDLRFSLAGFYVGDVPFGQMSANRARQRLDADPDAYPTFRNSELYRAVERQRAVRSDVKSIYPLI